MARVVSSSCQPTLTYFRMNTLTIKTDDVNAMPMAAAMMMPAP